MSDASENGFVALNQLRTVDEARLLRRLGKLSPVTVKSALGALRKMFEE